ncbi:hypothetical protein ACQ4N7_19615 [Nodosilinea sp. AN01ver1]|uniref:hypothetical protein n=1 Tax=Nodosilinea sp. AN01ver1 TaxID=3423362 RepID=UPI003D310228
MPSQAHPAPTSGAAANSAAPQPVVALETTNEGDRETPAASASASETWPNQPTVEAAPLADHSRETIAPSAQPQADPAVSAPASGIVAEQPAEAIAADPALSTDAYLTTAAALAAPAQANRSPGSAASRSAELAQADDPPELPQDPELGVIQVRSLLEDNDLGILRIRDQPQLPTQTAQPPAKIGFFSARLAIASSDNVLFAVNDVGGLTSDTFLRPSIAFGVYPSLGPQTALIATADLGLQRYSAQSSLNYDDLRFRLGLRQGLSPRSYGQIIFTYQELYRPGGNRGRFFKNTALGLTLGRRDPILPKLALDSYYLLQFNDAQSTSGGTATDFSRIFQSAGAYLGYDITPKVQLGVSYQLNLIDYTAQPRYDTFQQVLGQVVYQLNPNLRLNLYGGVSFGRSSEPRVRFNDTFFGAAIDATIPLF